MSNIYLNNIYYQQNKEVKEYKDIFLEIDTGVLKVYITSLNFVSIDNLQSMNRLNEMDALKEKYGKLYIEEVRRTYDNDMYLLISGKFILVIEYVLNSNFEHSVQEFRIIEDIHGSNKKDLDDFKKFDIVKLPSLSV
jgi:hypothetical protein